MAELKVDISSPTITAAEAAAAATAAVAEAPIGADPPLSSIRADLSDLADAAGKGEDLLPDARAPEASLF